MSKGLLVVISAPSGTGKTTICNKLLKKNPDWKFSISATTRVMREGEIDGKNYIFMDIDKFEHYAKFGDFVEWEWVHGNKYGTLISPLEDALEKGDILLLDVDVKGSQSIIEEFPDETISFFIEPPGETLPEQIEILEERLTKRGNESATLVRRRLKRLSLEMEFKDKFNHAIINADVDKATEEIETIIKEKNK
ncbi:MAG: guanylate kinase [Candidatus Marinimicrobia bacterium]|nr:guanylate kinase [Candidatus Neomarinimicrobiota bacterium]